MANNAQSAWTKLESAPIPRVCLRKASACIALDISERTLHNWMQEPGFPAFKRGSCWLIPVRELMEWAGKQAEQRRAEAEAETGQTGEEA